MKFTSRYTMLETLLMYILHKKNTFIMRLHVKIYNNSAYFKLFVCFNIPIHRFVKKPAILKNTIFTPSTLSVLHIDFRSLSIFEIAKF